MIEQKEKPKQRDALYITIIILLLAGAGFIYWQLRDVQKNLATCKENTDVMQKEIADLNNLLKNNPEVALMGENLRDNIQQMLDEYAGMKTNNKEMQEKIAVQIHQLDSLKQLAERHKYDAYTIMKLRKETETLRKIMQGYVHTIDSLNTLNVKLKTELKVKENELTEVKDERDKVKEKNKTLEETVAKGSALQTSSLTAGAIHLRNSGKQIETTRAGRADMIKACCTILENPIAKPGAKYIYMVVIKPDATILTQNPAETFKWQGGESQYSLQREIDYQNQSLELCLYADVKEELPKGTYTVQLFCEKAKIGQTTFVLK
jgi:myosin heavy subunit